MGKYSGLKETYAPAPVTDQSYQDKVNEYRANLPYKGQPEQLAIEYRNYKLQKEALEEQIRGLNLKLEGLQQELVDFLEGANLTQFRTRDGDTVFIKDTVYSQVEDKDAFHEWLKETGQESVMSVHYQTMNAMNTDRVMGGENPMPGTKVFIKSAINLRKAQTK